MSDDKQTKIMNEREALMASIKFQRPLMIDPEMGKELGNALLTVRKRALSNLIKLLIGCSAAFTFLMVWCLLTMATLSGNQKPPLLVVVSVDGMRFDMLKRGLTPNMEAMARSGVSAPLQPQFPAHTFPNHFTMVTGLYPARHGIVGNVFFDPQTESVFAYDNSTLVRQSKWWQAQPIWNTVQQYGLKSASVFWPGSEALIGGMRPNTVFPYDDSWTSAMRINKVIELASLPLRHRPNLITSYLSILDELGHQKGPFSEEVNQELINIDRLIGELKRLVVDELKGNLVIVSDHGMVDLPTNQHLLLSDWLPDYKERVIFADFGPVCSIIPKAGHEKGILDDLKFGQKSGAPFKVYTSDTLPLEWNYFNNDRIAPIIIQCEKGWTIDRKEKPFKLMGQHGYDPALEEMQAVFLGSGQGFREAAAYTIPFQNVDLYPLLTRLLWIQRDESRDGTEALSLAALRFDSE